MIGGLLVMVAAGCSGGSAAAPAPELDRATAAVLADAADRLAEALAHDDPCRALREADALRERAARALEEGAAPEEVTTETVRVVDATTADLTCEPVNAGDETGTEDGADDGDDVAAADTGVEAAPSTEDTRSDGSAGQASGSSAEDGDGDGDGSGAEKEPPGKAKGHDEDAGPPDERGKGRGNG